jgi:hypothetical protein
MKLNLKHPFFLYLLPLFFVFHGYTENYNYIPVKDAALLTGTYLGFAIAFAGIFWLLYRDVIKAALVSFLIMGFHFFFGSIHDAVKKIFPEAFITRYSFILPATLLFFLVVIILLKKKKESPTKLSRYLNLLFALLILMDAIILSSLILSPKEKLNTLPAGFTDCKDCPKPDIYYIILDEYAGQMQLTDSFQFDNSAFYNELSKRNFHTISNSHSNYNYTPFSVASTLNMDYLTLKEQRKRSQPDVTYCYEIIRNNRTLRFLLYNQYEFFNYSDFDFDGQPAKNYETFFPAKTKLITGQTFLTRFDRDIRYHLITGLKSKRELKRSIYYTKYNNDNIFGYTLDIAKRKTLNPKFVFTHLRMPHYPYYFDKNGKQRPFEELTENNYYNKKFYIEYLQHCNKKALELVDHILNNSSTPPIIILNSDHGFRIFETRPELKYLYSNLTSIYLPGKNYSSYPDSLGNINLFRAFFNSEFKQQLPLLKDSTCYIQQE